MSITYEQIMEDVSYALIEVIVNTSIQRIQGVSPGYVGITPFSMVGIYPGAMLIIDTGAAQEVVTVQTVVGTQFFTTTVNAHGANAPIVGATFPSGQTSAPLFTQSEIIGYINDAQSDFLLEVRPLYEIVTAAVTTGQQFYAQPPDCIRLERIAINPDPNNYNSTTLDLYETAQSSLDLTDPYWQGAQGPPQQWFRDESGTEQYGYTPRPSSNMLAELWYSQNLSTTTPQTLTTNLLVPDVFSHAIKYSVLARCWTKDGETRDPMRADYCQRRVKMITLLAVKFMTGAGVNMPQGSRQDPDFSPMPVQQGAK